MKSLLRPRWLLFLFLITGLVHGFPLATNESENATSTDLGHRSGASFFERRADPSTNIPRDLSSLLFKAEREETRLDTAINEEDNDEFHAPVTHITLPLGDQPWDMAIWDQLGSVVIIVVIQTRAIMIQIPFTLVQHSIRNHRLLIPAAYKDNIHDSVFGVNGCLTEFLQDPGQEITKDQRKFAVKDWSSDPIQVHVRTRKASGSRPVHTMAFHLALDQIFTDLRNALTKDNKLPNILPETYEDLARYHHGRYLRTMRELHSVPQEITVQSSARGIVLSWIPAQNPSDPHFLELWDGAYSQEEPVYIALEEQLTGLYPPGVEPTPGNGEYGLDYENKGCMTWAIC